MRALVDLRPLREFPVFRRFWFGTSASGLGGQLATFAVTFHVWDRTHNPLFVGLIGVFAAVPLITMALAGGAFLDHVDRRRVAMLTTYGHLAISLLMAAVATRPGVWAMLLLVAVNSGLSAIGGPARRAFIAELLPAHRLSAGLALHHLSFQLAMLLGPVAAGLITARWGTPVCFLIDAASFTAAFVGIYGLPKSLGMQGKVGRGLGAAWEGIRFTARTPVIRGALLADLSATVLAMPVALFPVINQERFGGSPATLGLFTMAIGVGGVLASGLSGLATRRPKPGAVLLLCATVWGAALIGVGLSYHLAITIALLAIAGGADTWSVVCRGTVVQASTPDSHRGRVASLEHIVGVAGPQLGGLRAGMTAAMTSGGLSLALGGIACIAGVGLINGLIPQLRRFQLTGR